MNVYWVWDKHNGTREHARTVLAHTPASAAHIAAKKMFEQEPYDNRTLICFDESNNYSTEVDVKAEPTVIFNIVGWKRI